MRAVSLVGVFVSAVAGCGLVVHSDVSNIDLSLPEREVSVDTTDWQLSSMETLETVDCADDPQICSTGLTRLCGSQDVCTGVCGSGETCEVSVRVALWHTFDLTAENPALRQIEDQPLVEVRVDRIFYTVSENSLDLASPPLSLHVAPEGTLSQNESEAEAIGTIPMVPAMTTVDEADVELAPTGEDRLAARLKEYDTPFNLIVTAELTLRAGDDLPHGRMRAVVKADAVGRTGL